MTVTAVPPGLSYLDRIVVDVRRRLEERKRCSPLAMLQARLEVPSPEERSNEVRPSFLRAIAGPQVSLVAEVKRRSPSKGPLRPDLETGRLAREYAAGGAAAVSVLTEEDHFGGSLHDLQVAASAAGLPVLRKDFIVDPYQVWEARACGASAVLLIARLLSDDELSQLAQLAKALGLDVLLEVHDAREMERALRVPEVAIGINNRDLESFQVSLQTTLRLAGGVPVDRVLVAESGIRGREDVERVAQVGVNAVLVGETLLRHTDPAAAARALVFPPVPVGSRGSVPTGGEGCL